MAEIKIKSISFVGAGNVASSLAPALMAAGLRVQHIISRNLTNAEALASKVGAIASTVISDIDSSTDAVFFTLPDAVIADYAMELSRTGKFTGLMVHTSGSTSIEVLSHFTGNAGVFYPLQTFNKYSTPDFAKIPICIEGSVSEIRDGLAAIAMLISQDVRFLNSKQRAMVHLSAVLACNFSNHLYAIAEELLEAESISPDILLPLIHETANRFGKAPAMKLQTGPAIRNDLVTLQFHLNLLEKYPKYGKIYEMLSKSILMTRDKTKS